MFARTSRLAVIGLALAAPAAAQTTPPTQPTGAGFTTADFTVRLEVKEDPINKPDGPWIFPSTTEAQLYFNRARCECDIPVAIRVDMTTTGAQKHATNRTNGTVKLYSGPTSCVEASSSARPVNMAGCTLLGTLPPLPTLAQHFHEVTTTVGKLFASNGSTDGKGCSANFKQPVLLWVDSEPSGDPDSGVAGTAAPKLDIDYDGEAPAPPANVTVTPGNEALSVSWTRPTVVSDIAGGIVFCSRADMPVFAKPNPFHTNKDYFSRQTLCPTKIVQKGSVAELRAAQNAATPISLPDAFGGLDPNYQCSDLLLSSTEWRIRILQNEIPYVVGVASVDTHGNASPIDMAYVQSPRPTKDFYRGYLEAGGEAGGCSYGGPAGGAWVVALVALAGLRARRRS